MKLCVDNSILKQHAVNVSLSVEEAWAVKCALSHYRHYIEEKYGKDTEIINHEVDLLDGVRDRIIGM